MSTVSRPPVHPLLVGLVDCVWCASPEPSPDVRNEWILPTCRAQIVFSSESAVFVGPMVEAKRLERRTGRRMVGVSLTAGAESAFTGIGGGETRGSTLPLDSLLSVASLTDRLAEIEGDEMFDLLEAALVGWLEPSKAHLLVLAAAHAIRGGHPAAETCELLGVDRRTFVPEFRRIVGAAPKHYERICRFNSAIEAIRRPDAVPLARVAVDYGFADQAHLTREVRSFARTSPSRLHRDGSAMTNHLEPDKIFKT